MIRAACLVARHFPLDHQDAPGAGLLAGLAEGLAACGVAVHVLGGGSSIFSEVPGIHLHRLEVPMVSDLDADALNWAIAVGQGHEEWDRRIGFDVVVAPELDGAGLKLGPGASTRVCQMVGVNATTASGGELLATMTRLAFEQVDLVIAPSPELAALARSLTGAPVELVAPPYVSFPTPLVAPPGDDDERLRILVAGALAEGSRSGVALEVLASLKEAGIPAELSILGREATGRRRREVFYSAMDRLGLVGSEVTFYDALSPGAFAAVLANSDALLAPDPSVSADLLPLQALEAGLPAFLASPQLASNWAREDPGLIELPSDPTGFVGSATAALTELFSQPRPRVHAPKKRPPSLDLRASTSRYLELFDTLKRGARLPAALRRPMQSTPRLGVVLIGGAPTKGDPAGNRRGFLSFLEHTDVPGKIACFALLEDLETLRSLDDPRLVLLESSGDYAEDARRGAQLLGMDSDYLVIADARLEAAGHWWGPYIKVFDADPDVGLVADLGATLEDGTPVPGGSLLILRRSVLADVGSVDPSVGHLWQVDLACRARRIGARLAIVDNPEGLFGVPQVAIARDEAVEQRFAERHLRGVISANTPFLVLADLEEALATPELLATYARAFDATDDVALVLFGIGKDPSELELHLQVAADLAELDLERGPRVMALVPPRASAHEQALIADEMSARLGHAGEAGRHLATFGASDASALRLLAARTWAARPAPADAGPHAGSGAA